LSTPNRKLTCRLSSHPGSRIQLQRQRVINRKSPYRAIRSSAKEAKSARGLIHFCFFNKIISSENRRGSRRRRAVIISYRFSQPNKLTPQPQLFEKKRGGVPYLSIDSGIIFQFSIFSIQDLQSYLFLKIGQSGENI
jgi:hypothetical protein